MTLTVNVTEHQLLEIPICMLHGDTRKGAFPTNVKSTVQYAKICRHYLWL